MQGSIVQPGSDIGHQSRFAAIAAHPKASSAKGLPNAYRQSLAPPAVAESQIGQHLGLMQWQGVFQRLDLQDDRVGDDDVGTVAARQVRAIATRRANASFARFSSQHRHSS